MPGSNKKIAPKQYLFADGVWLPSVDPLVVGEQNFTDIQNLRWRPGCLEVVNGFTNIVTNAIAFSHGGSTYARVRSCGQIITEFTTPSHILAEVCDASGNGIAILENTGTVPHDTPADFSATAVFTHSTHVAAGRFSPYPKGHIAFCNNNGSYVWAGDEVAPAYVGVGTSEDMLADRTQDVLSDYGDGVNLNITINSGALTDCTDANAIATNGAAYQAYAVRFKATYTGSIHGVTLYMKRTGSPGGNITVGIYTSTGTYPTADEPNTITGSAATVAASAIGTSAEYVDFEYATTHVTFPITGLPEVTAGTYYWIVVSADGSYTADASNKVEVYSYNDDTVELDSSCYMKADSSWDKYGAADETRIDFQVHYKVLLYIGTTRPIKGIKWYIDEGNDRAATPAIDYWDDEEFVTAGTVTDGTSASSCTLSKTGSMTFTTTVAKATPYYLEDRVMYVYRVQFDRFLSQLWDSGGVTPKDAWYGSTAYKITVDAPFQSMTNLWSGEFAPIVGCVYYDAGTTVKYFDVTGWVVTDDMTTYASEQPYSIYSAGASFEGVVPTGLTWGNASNQLYVVTPKRSQGFRFSFIPGQANKTTRTMTVERFQNGGWVEAVYFKDGTLDVAAPWGHDGVVWFPPDENDEETSIQGSEKGYAYRFSFDGTLTPERAALGIQIYFIESIEAPESVESYRFPFMFRDRPMLCGDVYHGEGYRVDYGMAKTVDVFNGKDSSFGSGMTPLYFGSSGDIVAAAELVNRFSSNMFHMAVFAKETETFMLDGYDADTFAVKKIHSSIGCAAPHTMDVAQITTEEGTRTIALWVSMQGPVICDGASVRSLPGLEIYFDHNKSVCVNFSALDQACGWYDPEYDEYNIEIPSGSAQTTNNLHLFYSFKVNRWYKKAPTTHPQRVIRVVDADGRPYCYGFFDTGYVRRLEYGDEWESGNAIVPYVKTGEIIPTGDMWDVTQIARAKVMSNNMGSGKTITVNWYKNGNPTAGKTDTITMYASSSETYARAIKPYFSLFAFSHAFKFTPAFVTGDTLPRLYAWTFEYAIEREDIKV